MGDALAQIPLTIWGVAGAPLFGMFVLAIFFPCANAIVGYLLSWQPKLPQSGSILEIQIVTKTGFHGSFDSESILLGYSYHNLHSIALNTK